MSQPRHKWSKEVEHVYHCSHCGVRKENIQLGPHTWRMKFTWPDGREEMTTHTPPCLPPVVDDIPEERS